MKAINSLRRKSEGFTLIELLVVISIIGILAAVVLVSLNSARQKSRDAKRLADVRQIMTALELFYNDNNGYPAGSPGTPPSGGTPAFNTYLAQWPAAPTPAETGCTAGQNTYNYTGSVTSYTLTFCLGAATGGYAAGPKTASPSGIQ